MKRVTVAYEQKDMQTLLAVELVWIHKTVDFIDQLPQETIDMYISLLKEQLARLEQEKLATRQNPRFAPVVRLIHLDQGKTNREIP